MLSTFAHHLCRLSILWMGTSTFLQITLHPARWHLCRISPLRRWGGWRYLPAPGSSRPKRQAQTKKGWKLSLAGESLSSICHSEGKASSVPAPPSQRAFLQDQPPLHHTLWSHPGPVVNMVTEANRKLSLYLSTAICLVLLPGHR